MRVSEYPIKYLRDNKPLFVKSQNTGEFGRIVHISDEIDRGEDYTIDIEWANGNVSRNVWHFWLDRVDLLDRCEECHGEQGGVHGNENLVDNKMLCDNCVGYYMG
ncbi:MAG TPA: hypothetical protein VEF04_17305 [Blastocatellia bacterium]|nr:hypothetical protein [Blastocatellia bacterium]